MKHNFFSYLAACHSTFSIKKIILTATVALLCLSQATAAPGETLLSLFNRTFPDAKYVMWTTDGEYHAVSFNRNETHCKIWYDKEGTLIYSLRYCQESELPLKVLLAVKKKYHDRHIDGVTELTNKNGVTYDLILSDEKKCYVINSTAYGELTLKYSFRKQE